MLISLYTYFLMLVAAMLSPSQCDEVVVRPASPVAECNIIEQQSSHQLAVCLEYNNDLRAPVSLQRQAPSSQNVVRHRGGDGHNRIILCDEKLSRQGRITHIFEFDKVKSSLRNAYYLHTLCRLRI